MVLTKVKARAMVDETVVPDGNVVDFPFDARSVLGSLSELRVQKAEGVVALSFGDAKDTTGESRVHENALDAGDGLKREEECSIQVSSRLFPFRRNSRRLTLTRTTG
jgi:hypothetical protein